METRNASLFVDPEPALSAAKGPFPLHPPSHLGFPRKNFHKKQSRIAGSSDCAPLQPPPPQLRFGMTR